MQLGRVGPWSCQISSTERTQDVSRYAQNKLHRGCVEAFSQFEFYFSQESRSILSEGSLQDLSNMMKHVRVRVGMSPQCQKPWTSQVSVIVITGHGHHWIYPSPLQYI